MKKKSYLILGGVLLVVMIVVLISMYDHHGNYVELSRGNYEYRYVEGEDADICDVIIKCGDETKYIFARFG
jgi:hypothetical protein